MSRTEVYEILVSNNIPSEWILMNWESVDSLSHSASCEDEFLVLIRDWFSVDEADGLV